MVNKADGGSSMIDLNRKLKPEGSPMQVFDQLMDDVKKSEAARIARERKNPKWRRLPDCYDRVCRDHLMSDGWTLEDAAHLLAGYVPGRPGFKDKASETIDLLLKHLKNSVGSSLFPSQKKLLASDLYPSKDLIRWALGKNLPISDVLSSRVILKSAKPAKTPEKKERKDTVRRKQAQKMAVEYWNSELDKGNKKSFSEVTRYLIKNLEWLDIGDDDKVRRWIKSVCPWRKENQEKYGNQG